MEVFPSPVEITVASALLLLSTPPPPLSPPKCERKSCGSEKSLALSNSKSCSSSVTSDDGSSAETRAHPLRMIASVARCNEMKLKVVRKSRSKMVRRSDYGKLFTGCYSKTAEVSSECVSDTTSSCLSTSSSAVSSGRSGGWKKEAAAPATDRESKPKPPVDTAPLRRRAEAIKRLLSRNGSTSEVRIRQLLGDSPDTSKALRMLLKKEEIKRSGAGGRGHPYIYTMA